MMEMLYTWFSLRCSTKQREPWEEPLFKPYGADAIKDVGKGLGRYVLTILILIGIVLLLMLLIIGLDPR